MLNDLLGACDLKSAIFSPCRVYRYALWRRWDEDSADYVMFVGLNPSTADETNDDPTIRRCVAFARAWGYSGLCMTNLFAYRATDPKVMKAAQDPVGADNDRMLTELAERAGVVIAAWGAHGTYRGRADTVRQRLPDLHYLRLTKDGHPGHPLYLPGDLRPIPWQAPNSGINARAAGTSLVE